MGTQSAALVSIVLPTLNAERHLSAALESCLKQTHRELEVIVVDGGSTDGTLDILQACADPRLRVLHQQQNRGKLPGALNLGFAHSSGTFLTWMQSDDLYELHAIESMASYLERHQDVDFVYCDSWWIDDDGRPFFVCTVGSEDELRQRNPVGQCFLYRRCVYERVGEYDPAYYMAEDYEYWIRVSLNHRMERYPKLLYSHRFWASSLTVKDYGQYTAARVGAKARRRWFRTSWNEYRRDIASAHIEEAFARYADGEMRRCRRSLLLGLIGDPGWLSNRGVVSMLSEALLGRRVAGSARALAAYWRQAD